MRVEQAAVPVVRSKLICIDRNHVWIIGRGFCLFWGLVSFLKSIWKSLNSLIRRWLFGLAWIWTNNCVIFCTLIVLFYTEHAHKIVKCPVMFAFELKLVAWRPPVSLLGYYMLLSKEHAMRKQNVWKYLLTSLHQLDKISKLSQGKVVLWKLNKVS